jgi:hypothetical protein
MERLAQKAVLETTYPRAGYAQAETLWWVTRPSVLDS